MNPIPMTQAGSLWPFLDFLDTIGAPVSRLLEQAGLPECALDRPENSIPFANVVRLAGATARAEGRDFALAAGRRITAQQFGTLGNVIASSATMGQAVANAARYHRLSSTGLRLQVASCGHRIVWQQSYPGEFGDDIRHVEAVVMMATINLFRGAAGPQWDPVEIRVDPELARQMRTYDDLARCRIVEAPGQSQLIIHRSVLAHPLPSAAGPRRESDALARLRATAVPARFLPALERLVQTLLPAGPPTITDLAAVARMSPRSLQRRLAERQTSVTDIVDAARQRRAFELIADPATSVDRAARACGYRDPANFTRAFRRWTGLSPRAWRRAVS